MSAALPLFLPHLPSLRSELEENLSGAAAHSDAGHECALPSCGFRGQRLMEVRRLGNGWPDDQKYDLREEFHEECDLRE